MPKIPIHPPATTSRLSDSATERVLLPTSLEVDTLSSMDLVSLKIQLGEEFLVFPLSPPTAKQLSRALRKAVRGYLKSPSERE